jgi:hypothetical protein
MQGLLRHDGQARSDFSYSRSQGSGVAPTITEERRSGDEGPGAIVILTGLRRGFVSGKPIGWKSSASDPKRTFNATRRPLGAGLSTLAPVDRALRN